MTAVKRTRKAKGPSSAKVSKKKTRKQAQEALSQALARGVTARGLRARGIVSTAVSQTARMIVTVDVDGNHLVPYSVRWDGDRVLDQLQPDQAVITITPGRHLLTWSFNHSIESTWKHKLTVQIEGQAARVLAEKSSSANPNDAVSGGTEIFVA